MTKILSTWDLFRILRAIRSIRNLSMNRTHFLLILLILVVIFRIESSGGLTKPDSSDPELEKYTEYFTPYREFLADKVNEILPQPQSALLSGILLGEKSELDADFKNALRQTSTIHIVVVSGQNLTLLIGVLMGFVTFLGRKRTIIISLIVVLIYSLLTGLQIPVLRAAIMVSIALFAQLWGREAESTWVLLITGLLMLIYQPNWLLSISFQLSFLATVGVIVVAPQVVKNMAFLPQFIREDVGVSLAAQALTWPVIAANFHQASIVGVFTNIFILWTISIIMISGILALAGALINPLLGLLLALIPGILLTYFVYIVGFFNSLPLASVYVGKTSPLFWLGYYVLILGIFFWLKERTKDLPEDLSLKNKIYQKAG